MMLCGVTMEENKETSKILVSIVVPIYNQEKYLSISVPSIETQIYSNLEIILVNDGSIDSSRQIIEEYAKKDSRIKIVEKENGGLVDATISGIKAALGDYIAFVDPDDKIGPSYIENFVKELNNKKYDFVAAGIYFDNKGSIQPVELEQDIEFESDDIEYVRTHYLFGEKSSLPSKMIFHARWNKIYKTECVKQLIGEFSKYKKITLGEDSIFTYLMLLHAHSGKALKRANQYYYNIGNQKSMINVDAVNYLRQTLTVYKEYELLMKAHNELNEQPYMLYFMLVESLLQRLRRESPKTFESVYNDLYKSPTWRRVLKCLLKREASLKRKTVILLEQIISSGKLYYTIMKLISMLKK